MEIENTIDKTDWPVGPWDLEPDLATWVDEKTGLLCLMKRHDSYGTFNGYVAVDEDSDLYGKAYEDMDTVRCHGGLTFSGLLSIKEQEHWCFGFDCSHFGDLVPNNPVVPVREHEVYRDFTYVKEAIEDLARQIKRLE